MALGTIAPAAWAGHGRGGPHKFRRGRAVERVVVRHEVVHRSRSNSSLGPAFAGFLGGLALGAAIGNNGNAYAYDRPAPAVRAEFFYWDPYCHVRYSSLDAYRHHLHDGCRHPHRVRVIRYSDRECVRSMDYRGGQWRDCERGREADWNRDRDWDRDWDRRDWDRDRDRGSDYRDRDDEDDWDRHR
jgi:hypothetical protein